VDTPNRRSRMNEVRWRVLGVIFGALPATLLGILAFMGAIAGGQVLSRNDPFGVFLLVWGALGVAGVIGLWLAAVGQRSWVALALVACGLVAVAPLVWAAVVQTLVGAPSWLLLVILPFGIGAAYVIDGLHRSSAQRRAVRRRGGLRLKPKDLLAWTIAVGSSVVLVAGICAFLIDLYHADFSRLEAGLAFEGGLVMLPPLVQIALVLGWAAVPATVLILLFNASRGRIEFSALGVKFKGPAGPIVLWVVTFLATGAFVLALSAQFPPR
jgi:hypothetical protein